MDYKEKDLIRLAAFIDGEGCISIGKNGNYFNLRVDIINTDPKLPMWCKENFGGSIYKLKDERKSTHRQRFNWYLSSRAALRLLEACLPYFLLKEDQAKIGIKFGQTMIHQGIKLTQDVIKERQKYWEELSSMKWINHEDLSE